MSKNKTLVWLNISFLNRLGQHTGQHIKEKLDATLEMYGLSDKISYVVSDNASNMAKAFSTTFPTSDIDDVDSLELWGDSEDIIQVSIQPYGIFPKIFYYEWFGRSSIVNENKVQSSDSSHKDLFKTGLHYCYCYT